MATTFDFSPETLDALSRYRPPRFDTIILDQSIPAGTQVPKGTVIEVRIGFSNIIKISDVTPNAPDVIKDTTIADLQKAVSGDPTILDAAKDPTTASDTTKQTAFVNKFNAATGKTLNAADVNKAIGAVKLFGR
jgi:hypothetical protein